jgi:hypothetical protein
MNEQGMSVIVEHFLAPFGYVTDIQVVRCSQYRADNAGMGTASTEILGQSLPHLLLGWMRVAIKDLVSSHDHAADTVATLRGLFLDEGPLQRVKFLDGSEAFYGDDLGGAHGTDLGHAGAHRKTPDQDRAGAALSQPTAKLGAVEPAIVAQDIK